MKPTPSSVALFLVLAAASVACRTERSAPPEDRAPAPATPDGRSEDVAPEELGIEEAPAPANAMPAVRPVPRVAVAPPPPHRSSGSSAAPSPVSASPRARNVGVVRTRNDELVDRGQLPGPSLGPAAPAPVYVSSPTGGGAPFSLSSSPARLSPGQFSPPPRYPAPVSTNQITTFAGTSAIAGSLGQGF